MKNRYWLMAAALVLFAGCDDDGSNSDPVPLVAAFPPAPQPTFTTPVDQRGEIILLADHYSLDGGKTWAGYDTVKGGPVAPVRVASDGKVLVRTATSELAYWSLADDEVTVIPGQPIDPGALLAFRPEDGAIYLLSSDSNMYRYQGGSWSSVPVVPPPGNPLYYYGFEVAGTRVWAMTGWGLLWIEDGESEWHSATTLPSGQSLPHLAGLPDGRALVTANGATALVATDGSFTQLPPVPDGMGQVRVCPGGVWLNAGSASHDDGATWAPTLGLDNSPGMTAQSAFCGESMFFWGLMFNSGSSISVVAESADGPWFPLWDGVGVPAQPALTGELLVTADGKGLVAPGHPGALHDSASGRWQIADIPTRPFVLADGEVWMFSEDHLRLLISGDDGRTWESKPTSGAPGFSGLFRSADGALIGALYSSGQPNSGGLAVTSSGVFRSTDEGSTWEPIAQWTLNTYIDTGFQTVISIEGDSYDIHGEADDGALIASHAGGSGATTAAVGLVRSKDHGLTWEALPGAEEFPKGTLVIGMNLSGDLVTSEPVVDEETGSQTGSQLRVLDNGGQDGGGKVYHLTPEVAGFELSLGAMFDAAGSLYYACSTGVCRSEIPLLP